MLDSPFLQLRSRCNRTELPANDLKVLVLKQMAYLSQYILYTQARIERQISAAVVPTHVQCYNAAWCDVAYKSH